MLIPIPHCYRAQEVWSFHGRDPEGLAEAVTPSLLRKGLMLNGLPTVISLHIQGQQARLECASQPVQRVEPIAQRLLGLDLDPSAFEAAWGHDPHLGPMIGARPGLRIAQVATPFEALTWAVIGQQINLSFALSLRRTFIRLAGCQHSSGLWCYPDAAAVARLDPAALQAEKFSRSKANTLITLARLVEDGQLCLQNSQVGEQLLSVKGVGPWTVNYTLLRGYSHPDCSLHGDSAVRKAMQRVFGCDLNAQEASQILERYRPYRSLAAAHFWASLSP